MNAILKEAPQTELGRLHAQWKSLKADYNEKTAAFCRAKNLSDTYRDRAVTLTSQKTTAEKQHDKAHEAWVAAGAEGDGPQVKWSAENQQQLNSAISDAATNDRTIETLRKAASDLQGQARRAEERFRAQAEEIYEDRLLSQLQSVVEQAAPIAARLRIRNWSDIPNDRKRQSPEREIAWRIAELFHKPNDDLNTPVNQLMFGNGSHQAFESAVTAWIATGCDGELVEVGEG